MANKQRNLSSDENGFDSVVKAALIASAAETESVIREFSSHRKALLDILRRARSEPFPDASLCEAAEQHTWNKLIVAAKFHFGMRARRKYETFDSQERKKIKQMANSIRKARLVLEKCIESARKLADESPLFVILPNHESFYHFLLRAKIKELLPLLAAIERAAELDLKSHPLRGRPEGTSTLLNPERLIPDLGYAFRAYTLRVPEAKATGDFHKLVTAFLTAVGYLHSGPDGLVAAIRRGIDSSLEGDPNSPFLDSQIEFPIDRGWTFVTSDGVEIVWDAYIPGPR